MSRVSLPILMPRLPAQRYSCHGCGNCCRDFTVQLREEDVAKLRGQGWEERLGEPVVVEFRGVSYLRQREDGACVFWQEDGRCRVHAEFGLDEKPLACQLFPFSLAPSPRGVQAGVSFACQSVLENKGAALDAHAGELRRLAAMVPEAAVAAPPPMLARGRRAERGETEALAKAVDGWIARTDLPLAIRVDGLAWLVSTLAKANFDKVRGDRFAELLATLTAALPDELALVPIEPAPRGAWRLLRQAVFARIEDVKLSEALRRGRARSVLSQLWRSRRFASGRGEIPARMAGWPQPLRFADVPAVAPAEGAEAAAVDELLTRWMRATVLGGRAWGPGCYGWPAVDGLRAMLVNLLATLWLARAHAGGCGRTSLTVVDVRAALGRVDRHAGRAPWLGSAGELVRIEYFQAADAWRSLASALRPV